MIQKFSQLFFFSKKNNFENQKIFFRKFSKNFPIFSKINFFDFSIPEKFQIIFFAIIFDFWFFYFQNYFFSMKKKVEKNFGSSFRCKIL